MVSLSRATQRAFRHLADFATFVIPIGKWSDAWYNIMYSTMQSPPGSWYWAQHLLSPVLWAKAARVSGSWRGLVATGTGFIQGTVI